jgi:hypothetical protein
MNPILTTAVLVLLPAIAWSYTCPSGHFICPNPLENTLGAKIDEGAAYVGFSNDWGERYRVETMPEEPGTEEMIAKDSRKQVLRALVQGYYFPKLIAPAVPGAAILKESYHAVVHGGGAMIHVSLPGAGLSKTHIDLNNNTRETMRMDATRAILVFIDKGRVTFVSSELTPIKPGGRENDAAEDARRSARLDQQILHFARQVQITD